LDHKEIVEPYKNDSYNIGTWNLRTLNQGGKLENLKTEMQKNKVLQSMFDKLIEIGRCYDM